MKNSNNRFTECSVVRIKKSIRFLCFPCLSLYLQQSMKVVNSRTEVDMFTFFSKMGKFVIHFVR